MKDPSLFTLDDILKRKARARKERALMPFWDKLKIVEKMRVLANALRAYRYRQRLNK